MTKLRDGFMKAVQDQVDQESQNALIARLFRDMKRIEEKRHLPSLGASKLTTDYRASLISSSADNMIKV